MQKVIRTVFATGGNTPYNNRAPLKEVPRPAHPTQRKGHTKYDAEFEKLLQMKSAIETTEEGYIVLNRALQRFLQFRNLRDTVTIRRSTNRDTRMITIWLDKREPKA